MLQETIPADSDKGYATFDYNLHILQWWYTSLYTQRAVHGYCTKPEEVMDSIRHEMLTFSTDH